MDIQEALHARHSVRQYMTQPLPAAKVQRLQEEIDTCNREIRLHVQLIKDELKAVQGFWIMMESFSSCETTLHDRNKRNEVGRDMRVS